MSDIFISYERGTKATAARVAAHLTAAGYAVWFDADLPPNRAYADVIGEQLEDAKAVLVLWSAAAGRSEWVRAEADYAREHRKLVQVSLDGALPPMPFNQIHCEPLPGWSGRAAPAGWAKVAATIDTLVHGLAPVVAPSPAAATRARRGLPRVVWLAAALIIVVAAIGVSAWLGWAHLPWASAPPARLAIAQFRVDSDAPQAKFFADGLADEIQSALNANSFQVVSRDDAAALSGPNGQQKLDQLGVRLLFDGSVEQSGQALSVTVDLEDPRNHVTVWSSQIDGDAAGADALRVHVAAVIVAVLNCAGRALSPRDGLTDPQALTQYLLACDRFASSGEDHPQTAEEMQAALRQVIARAPNFPPAHSALAKFLAYSAAIMPPDQAVAARTEAASEAATALKLDPNDADAYVALSLLEPEENWAKREDLLRKAVAANPSWTHANGFLGSLLGETGRVQEAITYLDKATVEDRPGENWIGGDAEVLAGAGDFTRADADYDDMQRYWADSPDDWYPRYVVRMFEGRWDDADAVLNEPLASKVVPTDDVARLHALVAAERTHDPAAVTLLRKQALADAATGGNLLNAIFGLVAIGDLDDAFAVAQHYQPGQALTATGPEFLFTRPMAPLRRDPRFLALADRLGLLAFWRQTGRWPDFCHDPGLRYRCS